MTIAGEGTVAGARYRPLESILPTMSFPPVTLFTCQVTIEFVPPETLAKNRVVVCTFRETVAGVIVTVIEVTGSVHELVEVVVDVVAAVVVHVMAVVGATYLWHETRLKTPISNAKS